jgi:hypothetical protein
MQTSIEWFNEKIIELDIEFDCELVTKEQYWIKRNKLLEQAKEIHRQEIIDAYKSDRFSCPCSDEEPEQYYQDTFKKD